MTFHTATSCANVGGVWDATRNCCPGWNCPGDTINQAECTKINKTWNAVGQCCVGYNGCTADTPAPTCPEGQVGTPPNCYPKPGGGGGHDYPGPRPRPRPPHGGGYGYPRPRPYYPKPYYPRYPSYRRFFRGRWWQWRMGRWWPYGVRYPKYHYPRYGSFKYMPTRSYYASGGCSCA